MTYAQRLAHPTKRRPVNISLSQDLVEQAKLSGINISAVAEAALTSAVQDAKLAEWARENAAGFAAINKMIEEEGLPLADLKL
jgi:post-segregation antitoxin (ccd killing protein)